MTENNDDTVSKRKRSSWKYVKKKIHASDIKPDATELDVWDMIDFKKLPGSNITEINFDTVQQLRKSASLLRSSGATHSYSTPLYKDIPYVAASHEALLARIIEKKLPLSQISSLLQIPPYLLKPRKRIDVKEELGGHHKEKHAFVSEEPDEDFSNNVFDYYNQRVQDKRVAQPRSDYESDNAESDTGRPAKRQKTCDEWPQYDQKYAILYNEDLVEFVTGLPPSKATDQRPGVVTHNQSKSLNKGVDESSLDGSFIQGTWWTAEEKEKFFVFLGRRSRHDMAGIAEAIGTKTLLECEVYNDVLFKEAQKLRSPSQGLSKVKDEDSSKINYNAPQEAITFQEIPSAVEMSDAWIEIEEAHASGLLEWESHLESECVTHSNNANSDAKSVYYNGQVKIMGTRKKPKPSIQTKFLKTEEAMLGETEDYFEEEPLPYENIYLDDPINNLVRAQSLMYMAHQFREFPLYDEYGKESATVPLIEFIDSDVFDEINEIIINHTRSIIRYIFSRLSAILARSNQSSAGFEVTEPMMLSILQEIQYTLPKHTLSESLLARKNIPYTFSNIETFFRAEYYNPLETTWHSNLLLARKDYQSAYQLLREPIHNSSQKPLETNKTDTVSSAIDIETDGSDNEGPSKSNGHNNASSSLEVGHVAKEGEFRDFDEDRGYLSDELLDYSAHPIGSRMRKKIMARTIQEPRHVDDFTENDIRDMIETVRMLEKGEISHTALLERSLLAQNSGRMPKEIDSDSEAFVSNDESSEWESEDDEQADEEPLSASQQTQNTYTDFGDSLLWLNLIKDYYKDIPETEDAEGSDNELLKTDSDSTNTQISIQADSVLAYEEAILNDHDLSVSEEEEQKLVEFFGENSSTTTVYKKLVDWYEQDNQLISKMFQLAEKEKEQEAEANKARISKASTPLIAYKSAEFVESDEELYLADESNSSGEEYTNGSTSNRTTSQTRNNKSSSSKLAKSSSQSSPFENPVRMVLLNGIDSEILFKLRLFATQYPIATQGTRIRFIQRCQQAISKNTKAYLAEKSRRRLANEMVQQLGNTLPQHEEGNQNISGDEDNSDSSDKPESDQDMGDMASEDESKKEELSAPLQEYLTTIMEHQMRTFPAQGDLGIAHDYIDNE